MADLRITLRKWEEPASVRSMDVEDAVKTHLSNVSAYDYSDEADRLSRLLDRQTQFLGELTQRLVMADRITKDDLSYLLGYEFEVEEEK